MSRATDHEVVSIYPFSEEQREKLLTLAPECVLMWSTKDHWPVGVVHSFVWRDGALWITFAAHRHRATAIRRDPRVSVTISGRTSTDPDCPRGAVTVKGRASFHDDAATKAWFYRALAKKQSPDDPKGEEDFFQLLDSPLRTILKVVPEKWITFDAGKSAAHRAGTLSEDELGPRLNSDTQRLKAEKQRRGLSD
ncbi:MAG: pyridoxamine 5'-phosphate oxidase family protein [Pseudomonadales bacterium]|nr:pyridoxamine 5'-phosphate oxidase family protein [Pseudomonadales bacterium]MCP5185226.1 pyridoxamine 5'-phosphate oxidase family protein [Pseudomonadales bacterium]